jgi:hypothetical protein
MMEDAARFFGRVLTALPLAGITTFVTQFNNVLHVNYLTHPDWRDTVNADIRPMSIVAVLMLFIMFYPAGKTPLRWLSVALLAVSLGLMIVCVWFSDTIEDVTAGIPAQIAISHWKKLYMGACVSLVSGATLASMWITAPGGTDGGAEDTTAPAANGAAPPAAGQ